MTNEANPPSEANTPSESTARDSFRSAAAEKMDASRATPVERSLWQGSYSPRAMYGTWVISAIVTIAAIVLVALFARDYDFAWPITGAAILFWWVFAIGTYIYRRFAVHYELTTQRFIHQAGLLVRRTDRIEVIDIDDVSYTQGVIQRMLGVGTIRITSSDRSHPELVLRGIDRVPETASLIDDIRREERRRRSLFVESV
jgi:uncharacterized membrane protein YdbT with pleckstrin-like domain